MADTARAIQDDATVIRFEEGIIGVPRARRFQLLEKAGSSVRLLRCLDIEGFCLPVVDPLLADPGYAPALGARVIRSLEASPGQPLVVLAVAVLGKDGPSANLRAPVVINPATRRAVQVILEDRRYPLEAPIQEGSHANP